MAPTEDRPNINPASPAEAPTEWPVLTLQERRVLGVLVEKAKTTPDIYPLSLNALVAGCNQKSNRDPVLSLSDIEVEEALASAQAKRLAVKITGGRVVRWRHALYEALGVDKCGLAILGELLLRGAQTEGELRSRASRMEPIDSLDTLRSVLRALAERRLVLYVSPEGRRGTTVAHGFYGPQELTAIQTRHGNRTDSELMTGPQYASNVDAPCLPERSDGGLAEARAEIAGLRRDIEALRDKLAALAQEIGALKRP